MFQGMQTKYYWLDMAKNCKKYAVNYSMCCGKKVYHIQKQDFLNSLPIPNQKWMNLLLNFMDQTPKMLLQKQNLSVYSDDCE